MRIKMMVTSSLCALGLAVLGGCASSSQYTQEPSGFLPDYSALQPVKTSNPNVQLYTYTSPSFQRSNYHAVMVAPVVLYQTVTKNGITDNEIESARENIQAGVKQIVSKKIALTDTPGPGVATLNVAITGAEMQGEGLKPWNLIPVSAAITLASHATGLNAQRPVMVVELKFTDSTTGQLLRETMSVISSPEFSHQANTSQQFQDLAKAWVQDALKYSNTVNS